MKMFEKKVAICIPTYNRAKAIKNTCLKIINSIDSRIIDIFIYDSSPNLDTKNGIKEILEGQKNIHYYKLDKNIAPKIKLYNIYRDKSIQDNYEYLWILPDYLFFSSKVIYKFWEMLDEEYDMIMLDFHDLENRGNREYANPNEIFLDFAWSLTQFGILIIKCNTVLKKFEWNYFEKRYIEDKSYSFLHVIMYFEAMRQIKNLKFYHFSVPIEEIYTFKDGTKPINEFLELWGRRWYESIHALPDYYKNKDAAIRKAAVYIEALGESNLITLRINGVLTRETFQKYQHIWPIISTVPLITVWKLLYFPIPIVKVIAEYGSLAKGFVYMVMRIKDIPQKIMESAGRIRLRIFCSKYCSVYIYGAGVKARRYADIFEKNSISFVGFIVTELKENEKELKGHKVYEISQIKNSSNIGIVLALNEKNKNEVIPILRKMGFKKLFQADIK